jgi:hypothetical protein
LPYRPSILPPPSDIGITPLQQALTNEFKQIAEVLYSMPALYLNETNVPPAKPRQGDIMFADGTNWNPGFGGGTYEYKGSTWVPLFTPAAANPIISSTAATTGTQVNFASIPQTYDDLLFEWVFLSHDNGVAQNLQALLSTNNGSTFLTCTTTTWNDAATVTATGTTQQLSAATFVAANHAHGRLMIPRYTQNEFRVAFGSMHNHAAAAAGSGAEYCIQTSANSVNYVRFQFSAGNFDHASGLIRLTGLRRSF